MTAAPACRSQPLRCGCLWGNEWNAMISRCWEALFSLLWCQKEHLTSSTAFSYPQQQLSGPLWRGRPRWRPIAQGRQLPRVLRFLFPSSFFPALFARQRVLDLPVRLWATRQAPQCGFQRFSTSPWSACAFHRRLIAHFRPSSSVLD